jgi:hypothetical protein
VKKSLKGELTVYQDKDFRNHENDFDFDDEGSTVTIGRTDTPSDINDILQIEIDKEEQKQIYHGYVSDEKKYTNESCFSPFFLFLYISLAV